MAKENKNVLYGLYDDDELLLDAVKVANDKRLDIMDVFTPFPVHGLDPLLGLSDSRLHQAGFVYGALGTLTAFGVMTWVFTRDWPIIFAGKPYFSAPAFIPITFELTVLFAAIGMVVTFYVINGLGPGVTNTYIDKRTTDDKFSIVFDVTNSSDAQKTKIESFFVGTGASEVITKAI